MIFVYSHTPVHIALYRRAPYTYVNGGGDLIEKPTILQNFVDVAKYNGNRILKDVGFFNSGRFAVVGMRPFTSLCIYGLSMHALSTSSEGLQIVQESNVTRKFNPSQSLGEIKTVKRALFLFGTDCFVVKST